MPKRKKLSKRVQKPLDRGWGKRPRGRPGVRGSEIRGRADNYRWILNEVWERLWPRLEQAQTEQDVIKAFDEGTAPYTQHFSPHHASLVLTVLREPKFPKRRQARINFLADSLAGLGSVTPRTSRDICARERAKDRAKQRHRIVRREFYIECTCGYQGPAYEGKCPRRHPDKTRRSEIVWGVRPPWAS